MLRRTAECLCDEHGLPLMAQITQSGIRSGGAELPLFAPFFYVFDREPSEGPVRHYTLGTAKSRDSICAKVPAEAVAIWSTVVGACPTGRVNVYGTFEEVDQLVRTGSTSEPMAVTPASSQRRPFLWPIAETRKFQVGDVEHTAWRIHFLGRAPGAPAEAAAAPAAPAVASYTPVELQGFQQQLRAIDVAWVVDATGSMEPFWEAAQKQVAGISARLGRRRDGTEPDVRFGLVAFRDHDRASQFVHRSAGFRDEAAFLKALRDTPIDHGGDKPEAGLDALDAALDLDWRRGSLTTRILVLVSDASFHEGAGKANPRGLQRDALVQKAKRLGVHVFGLVVGSKDDADRKLQASQYADLAERTEGAVFAIDEAAAAAQRMEQLLQGASATSQQRQAVLAAVVAGDGSPEDIKKRTSLPAEEITECLEFLAGAIDLRRLRPGEPAFASGWVLPNYKGEKLLDMRVLLSRGDSELLRDACRRLIVDLADRPEAATAMVGLAVGGRSALGALVDDERADVATYLAARHRLVFRPDSVLRLSLAQVRHMSEQDRRRRLDQVALALRGLLAFERDDSNFFAANGTTFGFAPEEVLP